MGSVRQDSDVPLDYDVCGLDAGTDFGPLVVISKSESGLRQLFGRGRTIGAISDDRATGPAVRRRRSLEIGRVEPASFRLTISVTDNQGRRDEDQGRTSLVHVYSVGDASYVVAAAAAVPSQIDPVHGGEMSPTVNSTALMMTCGTLLLPSWAPAQARTPARAPQRVSAFWVAPYLGLGVQNAYYDGVVQFSNGSSGFLTVDAGTGVLLGVQLGYRFRPAWTFHVNVSTASPKADYIEDLTPRPDVDLRTTQLDIGLLYRAARFRVGRDNAPLAVGGGLSLTSHSLKRFTWSGNAIRPGSTSVGGHGLAVLDIPLGPKVDFHGQAKLSVTPLSLGDLEEKIAAAEGGGVTAALDAGTSTYVQLLVGVAFRP